jgi:hypothetical protein
VGPLALPFIWKSPTLGKWSRAGFISANLILTYLMAVSLWGIYNTINRSMQDAIKIIEQTGVHVDK